MQRGKVLSVYNECAPDQLIAESEQLTSVNKLRTRGQAYARHTSVHTRSGLLQGMVPGTLWTHCVFALSGMIELQGVVPGVPRDM
jgi:hypothetical protein